MNPNSAVARFSDRVEDYVKYRPGYPAQVIDFLQSRCGLNAKFAVADIDFNSLRGRLLSSSYAPSADNPRRGPMLSDLKRLFDKHQRDDRVSMDYQTKLYCGQLG